jgi:hypothetical protein
MHYQIDSRPQQRFRESIQEDLEGKLQEIEILLQNVCDTEAAFDAVVAQIDQCSRAIDPSGQREAYRILQLLIAKRNLYTAKATGKFEHLTPNPSIVDGDEFEHNRVILQNLVAKDQQQGLKKALELGGGTPQTTNLPPIGTREFSDEELCRAYLHESLRRLIMSLETPTETSDTGTSI